MNETLSHEAEEILLRTLVNLRDIRAVEKTNWIVMTVLILRVNPDTGWYCSPSYQTICSDTRLSITTVQVAIRSLEQLGLIRRTSRPAESNLFHINTKLIANLAFQSRKDDPASTDGSLDYLSPWDSDGEQIRPPQATITFASVEPKEGETVPGTAREGQPLRSLTVTATASVQMGLETASVEQ